MSATMLDWKSIETAPFISAKRFLLAHVDGVPFVGFRYYADGPWHDTQGAFNLKTHPPTHWQEMPSAPTSHET